MRTGSVKFLATILLFTASAALAEPALTLRVAQDVPRNQYWLLQRDGVYLYDATTQALKQRYQLPGWLYVRDQYACAPDLAVDARGAVVISSNIAPVLWRVDPAKGEVTTHELALDADNDKDVGFSGLVYAADQGALFAVSSVQGSLWRIDPQLRRGQKIPVSASLHNTCALALDRTKTRRTLVLCARGGEGTRTVHLAPDQRSAYVRGEACSPSSNEM
jgi:streptogramin lyase